MPSPSESKLFTPNLNVNAKNIKYSKSVTFIIGEQQYQYNVNGKKINKKKLDKKTNVIVFIYLYNHDNILII